MKRLFIFLSILFFALNVDAQRKVWNNSATSTTPSTQPLTYARVNISTDLTSTTYTNANNGVKIPFNNVKYSSGINITGTDVMTPTITGRYRLSWLMQASSNEFSGNGYFVVIQNGVFVDRVFYDMMEAAGVNQSAGFIDVNLTANLPVELRYQTQGASDGVAWQAGSYFQITQLPTSVAILPATLPVTDQSSAGYFDIGNMRMQWGVASAGGTIGLLYNLNVPFANTNYIITANSMAGGGGQLQSVNIGAATTSQFGATLFYSNGSPNGAVNTGQTFNWIAIGQKP